MDTRLCRSHLNIQQSKEPEFVEETTIIVALWVLFDASVDFEFCFFLRLFCAYLFEQSF